MLLQRDTKKKVNYSKHKDVYTKASMRNLVMLIGGGHYFPDMVKGDLDVLLTRQVLKRGGTQGSPPVVSVTKHNYG